MEYKFKEGDKVRLKAGMGKDLGRLSISGKRNITKLTSDVLTILDATPGQEGWSDKKYDGTPTYTVNGGAIGWRIPEAFLKGVS